MTINIPISVSTEGVAKSAQDFEAIRKAIEKTAQEAPGISDLASALNLTYKEAKELARSLDLTADQAKQAVLMLKQLKAVGADNATAFQTLFVKLGLTAEKFEALNAAVTGQKNTIAQTVASYTALAKTMGTSIGEAQSFAKSLGLSAAQAQQAVLQLRDLDSVGASSALKMKVLSQSLGLSAAQFAKLEQSAAKSVAAISQTEEGAGGLNAAIEGIAVGAGAAGFSVLLGTLSQLPGQIAGPTLQFEKFRTVLNTLYGDAGKANDAFNQIQNFAATTPFQLDEVLQAFLSLKNRGIEPTNEVLKNLGDLASSQGKSLGQVTEAVLDAQQGEFERLKEFGIAASSAGEKATLTFKGVSKTVEKTPEAILGAIQSFGQLKGVAGGMEAQSKTLGGALSNLQDNLTKLAVEFGEQLIPVLVEFVNAVQNGAGDLQEFARDAGQATAQVLKLIGSSLKFVNDNATIFSALLAVLVTRMAALRAIALYETLLQISSGMVAAGAGTSGFSVILGAATVQLKAFAVAALAAAPALVALGAAVGAVVLVKLAADAKIANDEIEALAQTSGNLDNAFGRTAGKIKGLNDAYEKAGKFTKEQQKLAAIEVEAGKDQIKSLEERIKLAKAINPVTEEQKIQQQALTASLEVQKKALETQTSELQKNLDASIKRSKGIQSEADAQKELKKVEDGLKSKTVDEEEAIRRLEVVRNSAKAGKEAQQQATDAILDIRRKQTDGEISIVEGSRSKIEAEVKAGNLSQAQAEQSLTESKRAETQKRIALINEELKTARGSERNKLLGERQKLEAELTNIQTEAENSRDQETLKSFDRRRAILEGQFARNRITQQQFNQQSLALDLAKNDAELKQLQEQLGKLSASDTKGREAINAQIGEVYKKRADIIRAAYDRERKTIEEANTKTLAASKLAETKRQQDIQALKNSGAISAQQADQLQSESKLQSIDKEIAAEQQKYSQIQQLRTVDAASAKQKDQDLLSSQQRLADLTLQKLQEQGQAEERLRQTAIAAIKQQQQIEQAGTRQQISLINDKVLLLDKEKAAQDLISRSIDRQTKLLESANNLAKARASAEQTGYQIQVDGLTKALELLQQYNNESDPTKKRQQGELLAALGISTGTQELELVKAKQLAEDNLAAAKERARQAEQIAAQNSLDLSLKKAEIEARLQLIAAKRAELEAQISVEKAKQAVSDAQSELSQARLIKDPKERQAAVATAQAGLTEANQGLQSAQQQQSLAREGVQQAQQNLTDVQQMAEQQREILKIQQASENVIAAQTEGMRQLNQVLELSKLGAEGFAAALEKASKSAGIIKQAIGGNALPQARYKGGDVEAGQPYTVAEQGPEIIKYPDGSLDYILNPSLFIPKRRGHVLTARETASFLSANRPSTYFAASTVKQMMSVGSGSNIDRRLVDIKNEVVRLGDATRELAYTPRDITLNGGAEMGDAIAYSRELQRQRLRGRGL